MSPGTRRPGELPPLPKAATSSTPAADAVIGTIVGDRYKILERIGSGGMASVYRAEHQSLKKPVAVKLLLPELAVDQDMVARFEREAVAAARLDHPNCVSITDFGRLPGGRLFIVMEYLQGEPLSEIAGYGKTLPWERAVDLGRQILRGLSRAHEMGIVHRDLKASNIMVTNVGGRDIAKIIDFGIAKLFDGSQIGPHVETKAGIVFGTADFLAPERLLGKGDTDPRSDLYSVAILLYEMLTGERPFHDDDPYTIVKRALGEAPRPPRMIVPNAGIPEQLEKVVLKAMEKDPDRRFPSARDFLNALDGLGKRASNTADYLAGKASSHVGRADSAGGSGPAGVGAAPAPAAWSFNWRGKPLWMWISGAAGAVVMLTVLIVLLVDCDEGSAVRAGMVADPGAEAADQAEVARLVERAGEGDSVEERQRAFDRLVALGYRDRVPWVAMLSKNMAELPTCEERREVAGQLRNLKDPKALAAIAEARQRPENACFGAPPGEDSDRAETPRKPSSGGGSKGGSKPSGGGHF